MSAACSRGAIIASVLTLLTTYALASNRVNLYGDTICLGGSGFQTPEASDNGQCHKLVNIKGVKPVKHDDGCESMGASYPTSDERTLRLMLGCSHDLLRPLLLVQRNARANQQVRKHALCGLVQSRLLWASTIGFSINP